MGSERAYSTADPLAPAAWILGVERSGSTWLANIFDASPQVEFVMEPLAPPMRFFPALADRLSRQGGSDPALVDHLRDGMPAVLNAKWAGSRVDLSDGRRRIREARRALEQRLASQLGWSPGLRELRERLLHLNRRDAPVGSDAPRAHARVVVKELRANLKVGLIASAFPDTRFVVVVRDPVPQIHSILTRFERGGLNEVRAALIALPEAMRMQPELASRLGAPPTGIDTVGRLAWYWAVQYDTTLSDLADAGRPHLVVAHEELSNHPQTGARAALEFCDLAYDDDVDAYVRLSSTTRRASDSPVDTQRVSAEYVEQARARVPDDVAAAVHRALEPLWERLAPAVQRYAP